MLTLLMPYPPSIGRLWRYTARGGYRTQVYKDWLREGETMLARQELPDTPIGHPVSVDFIAGRPDNRKRDLDNLFKCCFDLLQRAGVLADDSLIHRLNAWWDTSGDVTGIQINIMPIGVM